MARLFRKTIDAGYKRRGLALQQKQHATLANCGQVLLDTVYGVSDKLGQDFSFLRRQGGWK
eukprot:1493583-Amphidinium_carterae.1